MDQKNTLKPQLDAGDVLFGAGVETGSPRLIEIYGAIGLDWAWIDLEHKNESGLNSSDLENLTRAAECADIELIVRLPGANRFLIRKVLDAGVRTICLPRVKTANEVRSAIKASKFEYDRKPGARGLAQGRSSAYGTAYSKSADDEYHIVEDDNVLVGVLIENRSAVENIEEILSVPDLGFVFPGPGDLGVSLGHTLDYGHSDVESSIEKVRKASIRHDVPLKGVFGSHFANYHEAREGIDKGYQLVGLGNDFKAARKVLEERRKRFD